MLNLVEASNDEVSLRSARGGEGRVGRRDKKVVPKIGAQMAPGQKSRQHRRVYSIYGTYTASVRCAQRQS